MLTVNEVTEIFYLSDEFSKEFDMTFKKHLLSDDTGRRRRNKPNSMSNSEIMTILIAFHLSRMRNLKHFCRMGKCTGISFIDSTALKVCHIKGEHQNRVFEGTATKGKSTLGWFFGFKLHIIINDRGEIISFVITQGKVDDRQPLSMETFH